jgi:hypothetical protein
LGIVFQDKDSDLPYGSVGEGCHWKSIGLRDGRHIGRLDTDS